MECRNTFIKGQLSGTGVRASAASARFSLRELADFRAAFGHRKLKRHERRERRAPCAGFTLVELMVASALALVIATAIAMLAFFSSRSFLAMANYTNLNQRSQFALDKMSKEIRQARALTAYSTNSLTFQDANGSPLQFTYNPSVRKLVRVAGGQTTTYLTECDALQFRIYQHTMQSNTFDCYDPATIANAKVIQVNWKCSRTIKGSKATTESVQSAKITIRNH
jgi:prepilin-type N-terminal cleavage/methylation domain-containing protein